MYLAMDEGEITNVAVAPVERCHGVGGMLLTELLKIAENKGVARIVLEVRASNDSAIRLYERNGFVQCGMRKGFYEFPKDPVCWEVEDQYLYGDRYLVAPILYPGERTRKMYLPAGVNWKEIDGDEIIEGGKWIVAEAPMDKMPVFERVE